MVRPEDGPRGLRPRGSVRLELVASDGSPWVLELAQSSVRFVGPYVRVPGFGAAGQLLRFLPVGSKACDAD